jgi:hypothetical protein
MNGLFLAAAILSQAAPGATAPESRPPADSKPPGPGFFRVEGVDFWGDATVAAKKKAEPGAVQESIWAEPIRLPDGRTTIYVPPPAVLGFLEDPTRETARAYLAWQEERAKKLKAAMELLRDLKEEKAKEAARAAAPKEEEAVEAPSPASAPSPSAGPAGEILYFKKPGCPWCARQDAVLVDLAQSRPALKIRPVGPDEAPELWKEHEVTVVPTLVLTRSEGARVKLQGFQPGSEILRRIEEVNSVAK